MAMHRSTSNDRLEKCGGGAAREVPVTIFAPAHMTAGPNLTWPSRKLIDALPGLPEGRWFQAVRSPSDIFHWRAYCDRLVELGMAEQNGKDGFKRSAERGTPVHHRGGAAGRRQGRHQTFMNPP